MNLINLIENQMQRLAAKVNSGGTGESGRKPDFFQFLKGEWKGWRVKCGIGRVNGSN